jgi:hypothetical protein
VNFIKTGDANTAFFHAQARFRKNNFIHKLMVDENLVTSQEAKQQVMFQFYKDLTGKEFERNFSLNLANFHKGNLELSHFDNPISLEEINSVVLSLPNDKAPGPDGYTGRFINVVGIYQMGPTGYSLNSPTRIPWKARFVEFSIY